MPAVAQVGRESVTFDIPPQPINEALVVFARQAGVRLVMPDVRFGNARSNPVRGAYDRESALAELLRGTGVAARLENGAIVLQRSADALPATRAAPDASGEPVQLAQATPPRTSATDATMGGRRGASDETQDDRVVIVGTNIRGVYPSSSPVEIFTAEDVARTGATTTEQFIQKLPQNFGTRVQNAPGAIGAGDRINQTATAGVDLRGLGVGTSLTLLNGRRLGLSDFGRTADVAMIPASAIQRVEVLTDGASAIYGSDAIGGVINFVLRDDFDGAETRLSYGAANGGLEQGDFSQTFGRSWRSGHGLVSYSAYSASAIDVRDRGYAFAADRGTLTPIDQRQNLLLTVSHDVTSRLNVSADAALSQRDVKHGLTTTNTNPLNWSLTTSSSETVQSFANLALNYDFSEDLHGSFKATFSEADVEQATTITRFRQTPMPAPTFSTRAQNYSALDLTAMLDGRLFSLPGGDVRFSAGAGLLDEEYLGNVPLGTAVRQGHLGRSTSYAFGELLLPLIGAEQNITLLHRLELNLAARYTSYDDQSAPALTQEFGDGVDPKIGLLWAPMKSLGFRGTYGTAFRAPSLVELDDTGGAFRVLTGFGIPFPNGPSATLITVSNRPVSDLEPETATTYTLGFDFRPSDHPGLRISGTYYNISYDDRIGLAPAPGNAPLVTPDLFPLVMSRPPSAAFIEDLIRTSNLLISIPGIDLSNPATAAQALFARPNVWISDRRFRNLAVSEQDGFDLSIGNSFDTSWGEMRYGGSATRIMSYVQQASPDSLRVTMVDTATRPVDLRARAYVGFSRGSFDGTLNVNYVDDYANHSSAGGADIESWTTADLSFSYNFGDAARNLLQGVRLSLSVQNLFDQDPPFVAASGAANSEALFNPIGFDPANANPIGRFVVVGIAKTW